MCPAKPLRYLSQARYESKKEKRLGGGGEHIMANIPTSDIAGEILSAILGDPLSHIYKQSRRSELSKWW
ncbi:hypothetical protein F511_12081 [Dorcoceras hygrometricum]|uniref:Uncharacterized protein n=1 Tax=Dorcoceras hygrometricum TaxID=472368 RepID=A0A2Z7ACG7_9LAMI|nr:hypothetical protein F511_12081 [Dorcoceras hygrometricum]